MASYWSVEDGSNSWGWGGKLGIPLLTDHLKVEGRAYWFPDSGESRQGDVLIVPVDLGAAISLLPDSEVNPYIIAGAGYVFVDADEYDLDGDLGYYAGAGVELGLAPSLELFTELLVRFVEFDADRRFDSDSYDATGISVNVGMQFDL
jgi:opacity protein-like surface antigen